MWDADRKIHPEGHRLASRGLQTDAEQLSRVLVFLIHTEQPLWVFFLHTIAFKLKYNYVYTLYLCYINVKSLIY